MRSCPHARLHQSSRGGPQLLSLSATIGILVSTDGNTIDIGFSRPESLGLAAANQCSFDEWFDGTLESKEADVGFKCRPGFRRFEEHNVGISYG